MRKNNLRRILYYILYLVSFWKLWNGNCFGFPLAFEVIFNIVSVMYIIGWFKLRKTSMDIYIKICEMYERFKEREHEYKVKQLSAGDKEEIANLYIELDICARSIVLGITETELKLAPFLAEVQLETMKEISTYLLETEFCKEKKD